MIILFTVCITCITLTHASQSNTYPQDKPSKTKSPTSATSNQDTLAHENKSEPRAPNSTTEAAFGPSFLAMAFKSVTNLTHSVDENLRGAHKSVLEQMQNNTFDTNNRIDAQNRLRTAGHNIMKGERYQPQFHRMHKFVSELARPRPPSNRCYLKQGLVMHEDKESMITFCESHIAAWANLKKILSDK